MSSAAPVTRQHGNSYEIFILVLTVLSLVVMGALLLPLDQATLDDALLLGQLHLRHLPDRLRV